MFIGSPNYFTNPTLIASKTNKQNTIYGDKHNITYKKDEIAFTSSLRKQHGELAPLMEKYEEKYSKFIKTKLEKIKSREEKKERKKLQRLRISHKNGTPSKSNPYSIQESSVEKPVVDARILVKQQLEPIIMKDARKIETSNPYELLAFLEVAKKYVKPELVDELSKLWDKSISKVSLDNLK